MFLVYTSDIIAGLGNKIDQYADDITLVGVIRSPAMRNEVASSLNQNLAYI